MINLGRAQVEQELTYLSGLRRAEMLPACAVQALAAFKLLLIQPEAGAGTTGGQVDDGKED